MRKTFLNRPIESSVQVFELLGYITPSYMQKDKFNPCEYIFKLMFEVLTLNSFFLKINPHEYLRTLVVKLNPGKILSTNVGCLLRNIGCEKSEMFHVKHVR